MKPIRQISQFYCPECERYVEVALSAKSRDVVVSCCDKPMQSRWTEYPRAILEAHLRRL